MSHMRVSRLVGDSEAVSPVIGIILMVALTVILATVLGTFVLGVGSSAPEDPPDVVWSFNYTADAGGTDFSSPSGDLVSITHASGNVIREDTTVKVDDQRADTGPDLAYRGSGFTFPFGSGDTVVVEEQSGNAIQSGDEVFVIFRPDKPEIRTIIGQSEVP